MSVDVRDVATGLWLWRQPHPAWRERLDWDPEVSSFAVASGGERVLLDPLAPPPLEGAEVYRRLADGPPTAVVILKPDHVRDVDLFVRWYGTPAYGPSLYWRDDVPQTELEEIRPGSPVPGGLVALDDGRSRMETPLYLPEQRALVFADAMSGNEGVLRRWMTPWADERSQRMLHELLELPFELVLVAHGEPVFSRADYEAALEREPWPTDGRPLT